MSPGNFLSRQSAQNCHASRQFFTPPKPNEIVMLNSFQHLFFLSMPTYTTLSPYTHQIVMLNSFQHLFFLSMPTCTTLFPYTHQIVMPNLFRHLVYFSTFLPHRTHTKLSCRTCFGISSSCQCQPTQHYSPLHTLNCHAELVSASLLLVNTNLHNTIPQHTKLSCRTCFGISYILQIKTSG